MGLPPFEILKRFFAPLLVSLKKEEDGYAVFVSNERREAFCGTVQCTVHDAEGRILRCETAPLCALSAVMFETGNLE